MGNPSSEIDDKFYKKEGIEYIGTLYKIGDYVVINIGKHGLLRVHVCGIKSNTTYSSHDEQFNGMIIYEGLFKYESHTYEQLNTPSERSERIYFDLSMVDQEKTKEWGTDE